jgi:hypothetical protein
MSPVGSCAADPLAMAQISRQVHRAAGAPAALVQKFVSSGEHHCRHSFQGSHKGLAGQKRNPAQIKLSE